MQIITVFVIITITTIYADLGENELKPNVKSDPIETDVLIIGAGLSGLQTARFLNQYKVKTIVIESRNRTGGRVWTVETERGHTFDLGAAWIHGIRGSIPGGYWTNPLWDLVQEAKIETKPTEPDDLKIFPPFQEYRDDMVKWYKEFVKSVRDNVRESGGNESLATFADNFVIDKRFNEEQKFAFYSYLHINVENQEGTELESISAKDIFDLTSNHYGEEHVTHKKGFMEIINHLAADLPDIRLERIVKHIFYNSSGVEVQTTNNEIYRAKYAVVTVPLGILKGNTITFDPPLPKWKMGAIDRIGYGLMNKAILIWDKAWWNETEYFFMRGSSEPNKFSFWINANKWNDRPALFCYFVGKEADRMEQLDKDEAIKQVQQALKEMYPDYSIPNPIQSFMTTWKKDKFANGSYSYISINQRRQDPALLAEPLEDRLLFAGEATNIDTYGFAHGALISARREATRLLYGYGLAPEEEIIPGSGATGIVSTKTFLFGLILYFSCVF